ncbi:phosphotransferase family protein [Marimonas arenosa]|uniref:Aminoglycoside phosphotransferase family protein n=1 Tax=Marimonas arenosa TaxID=1795305 RepID=A0AAE4B5P7_9RHOB|nr:aminoglycoside phosphotransferase family protein [Marimonas arenosa]MDQ2090544.1 aminoglycoside phosphotransferase family protein [Marimonas arenosa]
MLPNPQADRHATATLQGDLISRGVLPIRSRLIPLSGGRTNRLWRVETVSGTLVVKLYTDRGDNPLFGNDPGAEARVLSHLAETGLAPQPEAAVTTPLGPVLIYRYVAGTTWRHDPVPVAETLARLHALPPPTGLPTAPDGSAALARQTDDILARCPADAAKNLRRHAPRGVVPPSGLTALLHGDVVPGNLVCGPAGVTLIDWQCPARGDPVHDLAVFLSPAMQQAYRGAPLTRAETERFLDAYGAPATVARYRSLASWFHWRMAAYCLWRSIRGSIDDHTEFDLELACLVG